MSICYSFHSASLIYFIIAQIGTQVIVPYRGSEDDVRHIRVMGELGQIVFMVIDFSSRVNP